MTPWQVGDVFAGVGSYIDSQGIYKTVDGTGQIKLDVFGPNPAAPVPDLKTAANWTTGCFIDPTVSDGDMWTASWSDMTLSHFDAATHTLIDSFTLVDANGLATPLAALPRTVDPLPDDAIGTFSPNADALASVVGPTPVLVDYTTSPETITPVTGKVLPAIQAIDEIIFATAGPYKGQMYVGTNVPPDNSLGRGHGYLLRLQYTPASTDATTGNAIPSSLTLTGWWALDAGAIADRSGDRDADPDPVDKAILQDSTSNGASGVDFIDLSSDQATVFYTSQDSYIRSVNVVTGVAGTPIRLQQANGVNADGSTIWSPIVDARALGVRALPGKVDATGTLDPTAGGDGSAGFLVASVGGVIYRVDKDGHVLYKYTTPGRPEPITMSPDAQYFWTGTTQDDPRPGFTQPEGGFLYRFHIASGVRSGPFSPFGPPFPSNVTSQGHGIYGLCMKREYFAGAASGDHQTACFAMNPDGSPELDSSGNPVPSLCHTPTLCSPFARGVALSPSGVALGPTDPANADCYPPGAHAPTFPNQHNHEGDTVSIDLRVGNPDLVIDGALGLPDGLQISGGVITGKIATSACGIQNGTCSDQVTVQSHFSEDVDAQGNITLRTGGTFTWLVDDGNSTPTLALAPGAPTTATVLRPLTIPLSVFDQDANDFEVLKMVGGPPGMTITDHTGYGNGFAASIFGTPQADPPYPHQYQVTIHLFDCVQGAIDVASSTVASLDAAVTTGACYHHVSTTFTLTITNPPPVCTAASASPTLLWPPNHRLVPFSIVGVTDADNDPLVITIDRITQDQPSNGTGDGNTPFDATGVHTTSAAVRAERTGNLRVPDDGRLYQIDFTARDGKSGGTCAGTVFIGVPHDQGQHSLPADNHCRWDSTTGAPLGSCTSR